MSDDQTYLLEPVTNQEAVDFIQSKPAVSQAVFSKLLPELKGRAFTISGIEDMNVLQRVRDRLADLPRGADWNEIKFDIANEISPYFVDQTADATTRDAQMGAAIRRAELLLRTHGFQAYQAASWHAMREQVDIMPYWQYMTMEDDRVRPEHAELDGLILPADSPFWLDHYPPWDWGCRCLVRSVTVEDFQAAMSGGSGYGWTLSGVEQNRLETDGLLGLDNGQMINVSSPMKSGVENPFWWNPGSLQIPASELQAGYDPQVWAAFEQWAKPIIIEGGVKLLDWMFKK